MSSFLFKFVMDDVLGQAMTNSVANSLNTKDKTVFDREYADDVVCTFETFSETQSLSDSSICSEAGYRPSFAPAKCKTTLFSWT